MGITENKVQALLIVSILSGFSPIAKAGDFKVRHDGNTDVIVCGPDHAGQIKLASELGELPTGPMPVGATLAPLPDGAILKNYPSGITVSVNGGVMIYSDTNGEPVHKYLILAGLHFGSRVGDVTIAKKDGSTLNFKLELDSVIDPVTYSQHDAFCVLDWNDLVKALSSNRISDAVVNPNAASAPLLPANPNATLSKESQGTRPKPQDAVLSQCGDNADCLTAAYQNKSAN